VNFSLSDLNGTSGFVVELNLLGAYGRTGTSAGDINGDGVDDLIFADALASPNGTFSGRSYVVFGKDTAAAGDFPAVFSVSELNGRNGFAINGAAPNDRSGYSTSGAGDVNGDGVGDLILSAPRFRDVGHQSQFYIVFGKDTSAVGDFPTVLELSALDGQNGLVLNAAEGQSVCPSSSVGRVGDMNDDGIDDVIVGTSACVKG